MPLTEMQVRNAKGREKPYKLADRESLYLLVQPNGARYWRYDYATAGRRKTAALGVYPAVGLKDARAKLIDFKATVQFGVTPSKPGSEKPASATFGEVMSDWLARKVRGVLADETVKKTEWLLTYAEPLFKRDIATLKPIDVLVILRRVEAQGKNESAHRLRSVCSRIFRYAVATSQAERDICIDLAGALTPHKTKHHAAPLTPETIGNLLRAISQYKGSSYTVFAMKLGVLTFTRPFELRYAVWDEFDLKAATWRIPAARMKMPRDHIVPLSRQAIVLLGRLREIYVPSGFLFPSTRSDTRPMSENTVNAALRNMGFGKEDATHHGFRTMASTTLNERGWNADWIEKQLAHEEEDDTRRAYNAAEYLAGRRDMMQAWADLLDEFEMGEEDLIG